MADSPSPNREMDIPEEFRTKKRNLLWFSIICIALAFTDASTEASVKVPTLDISIPSLVIVCGLVICLFYSAIGLAYDTIIIIGKHSPAAQSGDFESIDHRFNKIADDFAKDAAYAHGILSGRADDLEEPKDFRSILSSLHENAAELQEVIGTIKTSLPYCNDSSFDAAFGHLLNLKDSMEELSGRFTIYNEDVKIKFQTLQSDIRGSISYFDEVKEFSEKLQAYGMQLNAISSDINTRRRWQFYYYDIWPCVIMFVMSQFANGWMIFVTIM